jgi:hypothetical protein
VREVLGLSAAIVQGKVIPLDGRLMPMSEFARTDVRVLPHAGDQSVGVFVLAVTTTQAPVVAYVLLVVVSVFLPLGVTALYARVG